MKTKEQKIKELLEYAEYYLDLYLTACGGGAEEFKKIAASRIDEALTEAMQIEVTQ